MECPAVRFFRTILVRFGPVAKYAHERNHIDHPERAWLMWFFALELNYHEKLWNANLVYRS